MGKTINGKIGIYITVVALVFLFGFMTPGILNRSVSPHVLQITLPVYSLIGVVNTINGTTISLDFYPTSFAQPGKDRAVISYRATFDESIPVTYIANYTDFDVTKNINTKATVADLIKGQKIMVSSTKDLRMLTQNEFTATSIQILPPSYQISGIITKISGKIVTINGHAIDPMLPAPLQEMTAQSSDQKIYTVEVTPNSEIILSTVAFEKLSLKDLKQNMKVTVSTNQDAFQSQELSALRINVYQNEIPVANPLLNKPASGSADFLLSPVLPTIILPSPKSASSTP